MTSAKGSKLNVIRVCRHAGRAKRVVPIWHRGVWAVTPTLKAYAEAQAPRTWNITHVPSGRALRQGLTKTAALRAARAVHAEWPDYAAGAKLRSWAEDGTPAQREHLRQTLLHAIEGSK